MKYQHLFFDLDHTLWDFDANARESLTEVYDIHQLQNVIAAPFDAFHSNYVRHNALLWERYHQGLVSGEDLKWKRMWRTLLDFQVGDEDLARAMSNTFLEVLPNKTKLFDYTIEILEYLTAKKYTLHLITNGFEKTQWSKLNSSGLARYFNTVTTSECSNCVKPAKEIFEYAMKVANTTFAQSLMLGDNLDADIQGAINAGMDNVFVNHINATATVSPTYTITHLKQLEDLL
jgi:putative hydrolase of the HAD superfamily